MWNIIIHARMHIYAHMHAHTLTNTNHTGWIISPLLLLHLSSIYKEGSRLLCPEAVLCTRESTMHVAHCSRDNATTCSSIQTDGKGTQDILVQYLQLPTKENTRHPGAVPTMPTKGGMCIVAATTLLAVQ